MRNNRLLLVAILVAAAFLRLWNLGAGDLANDEAKTALGVDFPHSFVLPEFSDYSQKIFGVNEWAARLPFAVMSVAAVYLLYLIGKEVKDEKYGLFSALVGAVLQGSVIFGRSAFLDGALVFVWLLTLLFWFRLERTKSKRNFILLFLCFLISFWFKIQAVYLCAALAVCVILIKGKKFWRDERLYLMVLAVVPFVFYFLGNSTQMYDMASYVKNGVGVAAFAGMAEMLKNLIRADGVFLATAAAGLVYIVKQRELREGGDFNIWLVTFFALILLVFVVTPKSPYYYVMLDPSVVFLSAHCLMKIKKSQTSAIVVAAALVVSGIVLLADSSLNPNYCLLHKQNCVWQTNKAALNSYLLAADDKKVFLDASLGFEGKWYVQRYAYKLDYLPAYLKWSKNAKVVVISARADVPELPDGKVEMDSGGFKVLAN